MSAASGTIQGLRFFKFFALVHTRLPKKKSMIFVFSVKTCFFEFFVLLNLAEMKDLGLGTIGFGM